MASYTFDLEHELPIRATLLRVAAEQHVLVLVVHHIAADGWSMAPLVRDLGAAYAARLHGASPAWAALPVQYADYTLWQRDLLGDEADADSALSRQVTYWVAQLAGLPEQIALPTDRPRPLMSSYRGGRVDLRIEADLHGRLVALARMQGATLFMVLQAGLAVLLNRLGAGDDIAIGTPIAGRTDAALDELVGFFVNTLVLRTDFSGAPDFHTLLGRVRETALAAYAHQDVPFERLVEVLNPARSQSHSPLFQVMLALRNSSEDHFAFPKLEPTSEPIELDIAKFDLTFGLSEELSVDGTPGGLVGSIEYASDLFDAASVAVIGERLVRVLEAVTLDPSQPVHRIEILERVERERILVEWNDTAHPVPEATLPDLFEAQAERNPDAIAVVFEDTSLTYGQLNVRANQLAHLLIKGGVGPESIVALSLPRSIEMIVGLLGILKAGGAYLPLDPEYPAERLHYMLTDANPVCLIATIACAAHLETKIPQLLLDDPETAKTLENEDDTNPTNDTRIQPLRPHNPAYVIYTSGSTGKPKGVVVGQKGLTNYLLRTKHQYFDDESNALPSHWRSHSMA